MNVDFGEDFWILFRAPGSDIDAAIGNVLARLAQDGDDVVAGTSAHGQQQRFHGSRSQIAPACLRRTIHDDPVPGRRFTDERRASGPCHARLHGHPQLVEFTWEE